MSSSVVSATRFCGSLNAFDIKGSIDISGLIVILPNLSREYSAPNITGQINKLPTPWNGLLYEQNGALKPVNVGDKAYGGNSNGSNFRLELDASGANEIFGNSTTVQPPSMALLPCIKF